MNGFAEFFKDYAEHFAVVGGTPWVKGEGGFMVVSAGRR